MEDNQKKAAGSPQVVMATLGMALAIGACAGQPPEQGSEAVTEEREGLTVYSRETPDGIWTVLTDAEHRVLAELEYSTQKKSAVLHDEASQSSLPIDLSKRQEAVTLATANDIMFQAWTHRPTSTDATQRGTRCWWESDPENVNGACGCEWYGCYNAPPSLCCWWC